MAQGKRPEGETKDDLVLLPENRCREQEPDQDDDNGHPIQWAALFDWCGGLSFDLEFEHHARGSGELDTTAEVEDLSVEWQL